MERMSDSSAASLATSASIAQPRPRRRPLLLAGAAVLVLIVLAIAWQLAVRQLQSQVLAALGPRASVASIGLSWGGVELRGLRIAAAKGWPAADELRAERVRVTPDLWRVLRGTLGVRRIVVDQGYVSLLRGRDGRTRLLPSLLEARSGKAGDDRAAPPALHIGSVLLERSEVAFFDASVRNPPQQLRLAEIDAQIGPLVLPALDVPTSIELAALLQGPQGGAKRSGTLKLDGRVTAATRDADLKLVLRGVELVPLQAYLGRDVQVKRGRIDLDLKARVQRQQLHAPGRLVLHQLEFGSAGIAGLPRQALASFASKNERIDLDFTLEGRLDDPSFSLNENLATRVAAALAAKLGVSVGGVVEGVGSVVRGLFGQ